MAQVFQTELIEEGILKIVFDLPEQKVNIFNRQALEAFSALIDQLENNTSLRLVIFLSGKPDNFIAGADVHEILKITSVEDGYQKSRLGQQLFTRWEKLRFPTVAVVNGACLGGGTEFILSCTYRLATDHTKTLIGLPEVKLGILPGWGGTQRLPRLIGLQNALKMILSGNPVNSRRAYRMGLVDEVLPHQVYEELALKIAREIHVKGETRYIARRKKKPSVGKVLEFTRWGRDLIFKKSREMVMKQTRGHYPAPLRVLESVKLGLEKGFQEGLDFEARQLAELASTDICKNLIRLFLDTEMIKKQNGVENEQIKPEEIHKIAILGAGVMGGGIAQLAAYRDHPVRVKDIDIRPLTSALKHARSLFDDLVKKRRLSQREAEMKMDRISITTDYSGFKDVDLVIEAVVEDIKIKKQVFQEVDRETPEQVIIVSNTSSIPITEMAASIQHPDHFAGLHFFNPVHRMPLLEIIRGKQTSDQTVVTLYELAKKWGKTPIVVNDGPGFLVNRLLMPYMSEAVALLEEGVPITDIDRAMLDFGMPMGPFRLYDEVGIDITYKAGKVMQKYLAKRLPESRVIEKMVQNNRLGKKTRMGFYLHKQKKRVVDQSVYTLLDLKPTKKLPVQTIQERLIFLMINEAAYCLAEKIVGHPRDVDLGMIFGTGFPPFRGGPLRYADSLGVDTVVEKLRSYQEEIAPRYKPAPLLNKLVKAGKGFHDFYGEVMG